MAKAPARSKAAGSASSGTTTAPGITTQEISELRAMFSVSQGRSSTPTPPFLTQSWSPPSPKPGREVKLEPTSSPGSEKPKAEIVVKMPSGDVLTVVSDQVTINFDRDFQDITTRSDAHKVYMVDRGTVTIVAKL